MAGIKNYYNILRISVRATQAQIKTAYRRAVKHAHPDTGGTQAEFEEIQQAYSILGSMTRRAAYDRVLQEATASAYATAPAHSRARSSEGIWVSRATIAMIPWLVIIPAILVPVPTISLVAGQYLWRYCASLYRELPARDGPVGPATFVLYPLLIAAYLIFATAMSLLVIGFGLLLLSLTGIGLAMIAYLMVALKHFTQPFSFLTWQHYFAYEYIRLSGATSVLVWQRSEPPTDQAKYHHTIDRLHEGLLILMCLALMASLLAALIFEPTLGLWPLTWLPFFHQ